MKFEVNAENKSHNGRPYIGNSNGGGRMNGHGVRKEIDGKPQKKAQTYKCSPIFFDRVPVEKKNVDHRIDEPEKIQPIENENLHQHKQSKPDYI